MADLRDASDAHGSESPSPTPTTPINALNYAEQIDRLIPEAERMAYEQIGPYEGGPEMPWVERWNAAFHHAMAELAIARGLRRRTP